MSAYPTWVDDDHVTMGKFTYDVQATCDYYHIDRTGWCPQVGFSTKKGGDRLSLCPHWNTSGHTSLTSSAHVNPTNFNIQYVEKHFAKAATAVRSKTNLKGKKRKSPA